MSEYTQANELDNMVAGPSSSSVIRTIFKSEDGILVCHGTSAISVLEAEDADTYAPGCIYVLVSGAASKVYLNQAAAGSVADFGLMYAGDQAAALTSDLTDLTSTAPGAADYAIQDLVQSAAPTAGEGFGFVTKDEGNTVLKVIQANKVRIAELETKLQALGILA